MPKPYLSLCIFLAVAWVAKVSASPEIEFRKPSQEIVRLAENPRLPLYSPDPTRKRFLRLEASGFMPMERLAREEIVLAGFQMFVETRCRSEMIYANNIAVVEILSGKELTIEGIPEDPVIIHAHWSPNGKYVAVLIESDQAVNLWKVDAIRGKATLWSELPVHAGMRQMLDWSGDSQSIWLKTISKSLGERPIRPPVPTGAIVRQTTSQPLPTQTNRGLIKTQFDVEEFEYFFTSQMTRISLDGSHQHVGQPGLFRSFYDSPDQKYLLVERLVQPWSYLVTEEQFAYDLEVWDLESLEVKRVASAPLVEELPYGGGMVRRGARDFEWRSDEPATVVWVEAQDGGNSYNTSRIRDKIFANSAPFTGSPKVLFEMEDRYGDLLWYKEDQAILISWNWIDRDITISSVNPLDPDSTARRLVGFQMGNRYRHPGFPILTFNGQGFPILQTDEAGEHMY
ncbi:MAG: hypothetical protein O7C75_02655, partial [Verrucomicrobia bacterium]|nr:hypothetical protein [Verrucomicrobiota bacterium]